MSIIQLIENFSILQQEEPCLFILRHAEKPRAVTLTCDIAHTITAAGARKAKELGNRLHKLYPKIDIVRTSPIQRCLATAYHIFSRYSAKFLLVSDTALGGDGVYVADAQVAAQHFVNNPARQDIFIRMQQGEIFAGMRTITRGTQLLFTKIAYDLENIKSPSFYITHDCILALFVGSITGRVVNTANWFHYLDGICIKKSGTKINLFWENHMFTLTSSPNLGR